MKNKKMVVIKIIIGLCSIYYLWMLVKIIILKNGFAALQTNINLELFDFIKQYHRTGLTNILLINILGNVALFIPLSIILKHYFNFLNNYNIAFIGFFTSLSFELIQLGTNWGVFDLDDIFLNTIGCLLGIGIYHLFNKHRHPNVITSVFLICFGSLGFVSLYHYCPNLLTTFIV